MEHLPVKSGDRVELIENDIFKDRLYKVTMTSATKVMIDVSMSGVTSSAIISPSLIAKVITPEELEASRDEAVLVEKSMSRLVLDPNLFNRFED